MPRERDSGAAMRYNDLDLQRAVEQAALLMWLHSGVQPRRYISTRRRVALWGLTGYLAHAHCRGRVVHRGSVWSQSEDDDAVWSSFLDEGGEFGSRRDDDRWCLDFVLSPVDGVRALDKGMDSGAISALAAGPRGCFLPEFGMTGDERLADHYLIVLLPPGSHPGWAPSLPPASAPAPSPGVPVEPTATGFEPGRLLNELRERADRPRDEGLGALVRDLASILGARAPEGVVPCWATSTNEEDVNQRVIGGALQRHARVRNLSGSSLAAGLTVLFPHFAIQAYVGVVRLEHAILLAAAAQVREAELLAVPLRDPLRDQAGRELVTVPSAPILTHGEFVPVDGKFDDVFVLATGITDSLALRGVRMPLDRRVQTETLCLRAATRSSRFVSHHHDLRAKPFRLESSQDVVVRDFLTSLEQRGISLRIVDELAESV